MTRLFLHFWNVVATFRIWSSGKKNPYLKYVSSHFLILAVELHLVRFGSSASFTFELLITIHTFAVVIISLHIHFPHHVLRSFVFCFLFIMLI